MLKIKPKTTLIMNTRIVILFFLIQIIINGLHSQVVFEHVSNKNIYEFVDELATEGIVEINSAIKPYSRKFIAECLVEAGDQRNKLNTRQQKELDFYLIEYKTEMESIPVYNPKFDLFKKNKNLTILTINPLGGVYKDDFFTFAVKPIWGINFFTNDNNGTIFHRWGGLKAHAYVGKHWGFYASLRDNNETKRISWTENFTLRPGGAYKRYPDGSGDYSEMRGGVIYSWEWGSLGLVKDHITWGNNYHGAMIMSDRAPSFAQIKFNVKPVDWFELNYYHGWLVSMEIDSVRSYFNASPPREVFRPKFIAANMLTFTPWRKLNISMGNSIVYSDMNVHLAYLIPIMFYKSIDHTVNYDIDNQNSQMFFEISSRNIKNVHLYGTLFVDELKVDRIGDPDKHNFWSAKTGFKTYNLVVPNLTLNVEYSMSMPLNYEHRVPTLTYQSNNYNLGYYLGDNSREIYTALMYKPIRGLHLKISYMNAQHGPDYSYDLDEDVVGNPFLERVVWENQTISFGARYEFISNAYLFAEYIMSDITGEEAMVERYTPEFFRGKNNTISFGFNIGF